MVSPARRHYLQEAARLQHQEAAEIDLANLPPYQRLLVGLQKDKAALKLIESIQDKARAKADMLPQYADWMQGVIQGGQPAVDDEVFTTCLLWMIDTGALTDAVPLAEFAIAHGLQSADEYQRSLPTLLIEQMGEQIAAGHNISQANIERLTEMALAKAENGMHQVDMPDAVRAKFLKAAGVWNIEFGSKSRAADLLDRAIAYDERVGANVVHVPGHFAGAFEFIVAQDGVERNKDAATKAVGVLHQTLQIADLVACRGACAKAGAADVDRICTVVDGFDADIGVTRRGQEFELMGQ